MHCLHFCKAAYGWWKEEHTWLFFIVDHMCNLLHTNFLSPQAVGKDMVNTCWRDSDFCRNCHALNTVHTFKDRFHLFHVAYVHRRCWCSTVRGIIWLFLAIFNNIHPSVNSFTWRSIVSLNLSSTTRSLLPNKTWNCVNVLISVCEKLPLIFPNPQLNSTDITQAVHLHHSSNSATSATQVIWVQSYEALHGAATTHKTSKMTHTVWQMVISVSEEYTASTFSIGF